jgi:transposase-like protein
MQYSQEVKARPIEHPLRDESTQNVFAEQFGISRSTVQNWMRAYRASGQRPLTEKDKRLPAELRKTLGFETPAHTLQRSVASIT